jgi:hypothetical protein
VDDQSSGKSSVLKGLTGLPFPRDSGLCTRFPTQIVFKRSKILTTEASIMAAHRQDGSKIDAIVKFDKKQLKAFDQKTFSDILTEVNEHSRTDAAILTPLFCSYTDIGIYRPSITRV